MKYIVLISMLILTGCSSLVPVSPKFPTAPDTLLQSCPKELTSLSSTEASIIDVTKNVVKNYETYHICAEKNDAWIEWYTTQRKIFTKAGK
jgi:hypothetical protein